MVVGVQVCALLLSAAGAYGMYFTAVERWDGKGSLELAYIVITDLSGVLLALGAIIWMVSFAGCVGALRENLCLLRLYFWSVTIFLILELILAIAFLVFPWKSREIVESILKDRLIEDYRESDNTKDFMDMLQMRVGCCGLTSYGYLDWDRNEYFNCSESNPSRERCGVPHSCCLSWSQGGHRDMMCGYGMQSLKEREASEIIHTRGCMSAIIQLLENNLYVAAGVIFAITLYQMYVTHQAKTLLDQIELQMARWY
ncbi:Tetraspanin/Peripherin [Trinorchestia longiramus]|nr:Tetraspanin/Peripherin [Trinorchestia longiramus]